MMEIVRKEQRIVPATLLHPGMVFYLLDTPQDIWLTTEEARFKYSKDGQYRMVTQILVTNIKTGALKTLDFVKEGVPDVRLLNVKLIIEGE